jgi:hypothetical protein
MLSEVDVRKLENNFLVIQTNFENFDILKLCGEKIKPNNCPVRTS